MRARLAAIIRKTRQMHAREAAILRKTLPVGLLHTTLAPDQLTIFRHDIVRDCPIRCAFRLGFNVFRVYITY